jgi:hypothetical protein
VVTVLTEKTVVEVAARPDGDALWVGSAALPILTGFELKPEGACRDDICIPLSGELCRTDEVDVAGFWRHTRRPVLRSDGGAVWLLAEGALERRTTLATLQAPDFTLPDAGGVEHTLSDFRGKKVFLATWASW